MKHMVGEGVAHRNIIDVDRLIALRWLQVFCDCIGHILKDCIDIKLFKIIGHATNERSAKEAINDAVIE